MANKLDIKGYFNPKRMTQEEMRRWTANNQERVHSELHTRLMITGDARVSIGRLIIFLDSGVPCNYEEFDA